MKKSVIAFTLSAFLLAGFVYKASAQSCPVIPYAVVELFTSHGCSYCPPAEEALDSIIAAEKISGRNVISIAEHVTYWNGQWVDPFSDAQFSPRQTVYCQYAGVQKGTPEAFVNGKQVVAPSPTIPALNTVINNQLGSGNTPSAGVCITMQTPVSTPTLTIGYTVSGNYTGANLIVCLVEDKLVTTPNAGENAGVTLNEDGVSRKFIITPITSATGTIDVAPPSNCIRTNSQIVAYVQTPSSMVIRGATRGIDLSSVTTAVENDITLSEMQVYPNPATTSVMITGATFADKVTFSILNLLGEVIKTGELFTSGDMFSESVQVNDIPSGMYFLKVTDGKTTFAKKLNKL